jgi:uncharacterized protein (TIGR03437 family)
MRLLFAFAVIALEAHATQINTTLTLTNASFTVDGSSVTGTGPVTLTNIGSGTFSGAGDLSNLVGTNASFPYTITLTSGNYSGATITGNVLVSATLLTFQSTSATGSMSVTGGTGAFANANGFFQTVNATSTGTVGVNLQVTLTGSGYIVVSGAAGGGSSAPTITAVQNNYSYLVPGAPNYGIAPGSLFIIKGTGMAAAGAQAQLWDLSKGPLPQSAPDSKGTSISVVVNGTTVHPGIYYYTATQLAAVLPSNTPAGNGTVTVAYNGQTSQQANILVVPSAMGFDTIAGIGSGQVVATDNTTGALISFTSSAKWDQVVVLWGSGVGADTANDDLTYPAKQDQLSAISALYVGGVQAKILYQGRSQFPGVDQIDVVIPEGVSGCYVGITAVSGTGSSAVVSNSVSMPIEQSGGECGDPSLGITGSSLVSFGNMNSVSYGTLNISQETAQQSGVTTFSGTTALGVFDQVQGAQYGSGYGAVSVGSCFVSSGAKGATGPFPNYKALDAGKTITVTGGSPSPLMMTTSLQAGLYQANFASGFTLSGGSTFTFNNGSGGKDVGGFNVTVTVPNPPFTWTNMSSIQSVTRSQGITVNWTGGDPSTFVAITGSSSNSQVSASFTCYAPQPALTFTVPSYVLLALPAGSGSLFVYNQTAPVSFTATGINYGNATIAVGNSISPNYN